MHGVAFVLSQQPTQGHKGACPRTCKSWSSLKRHKQLDLQTPVLDSVQQIFCEHLVCANLKLWPTTGGRDPRPLQAYSREGEAAGLLQEKNRGDFRGA